jgi:hypothetical protein
MYKKILSALAPLGIAQTAPAEYSIVSQLSYLPTIACTFTPTNEPVTTVNCLLDNTSSFSTAWLTDCVQSSDLATTSDLSCDSAPSNEILWIEPWYEFADPISIFTKPVTFSGYDTVTQNYYLGASQSIEDRDGVFTASNSALYTISEIDANRWLYGVDTNAAGSIGLGTDSPFLNLNSETAFNTPWMINMG